MLQDELQAGAVTPESRVPGAAGEVREGVRVEDVDDQLLKLPLWSAGLNARKPCGSDSCRSSAAGFKKPADPRLGSLIRGSVHLLMAFGTLEMNRQVVFFQSNTVI